MQGKNCVGTETCYIFCFPLQVSRVKFLVYRKLVWKFLVRISLLKCLFSCLQSLMTKWFASVCDNTFRKNCPVYTDMKKSLGQAGQPHMALGSPNLTMSMWNRVFVSQNIAGVSGKRMKQNDAMGVKDLPAYSWEFVQSWFLEQLIQRVWPDLLWSSANRWWKAR